MSRVSSITHIVRTYEDYVEKAGTDVARVVNENVARLSYVSSSDIETILGELPDKTILLFEVHENLEKSIRETASENDVNYLLEVNNHRYLFAKERLGSAKSQARHFLEKKFAKYLYTGYNYSKGSLDHVFGVAYREKISEGYKAVEERFHNLMGMVNYVVEADGLG